MPTEALFGQLVCNDWVSDRTAAAGATTEHTRSAPVICFSTCLKAYLLCDEVQYEAARGGARRGCSLRCSYSEGTRGGAVPQLRVGCARRWCKPQRYFARHTPATMIECTTRVLVCVCQSERRARPTKGSPRQRRNSTAMPPSLRGKASGRAGGGGRAIARTVRGPFGYGRARIYKFL